MNASQDKTASGQPKQLPAPDASRNAGGARDQAHVAALLQSIAAEISQSDQRQTHALADLRARLDVMTERKVEDEAPVLASPQAPASAAKPALALPDLRPSQVPAAAVKAERPAISAQSSTPAARPDISSLDRIYAAVAQSYTEVANQTRHGKPVISSAPVRAPEAFAALDEAADDGDEFLDMSALADPQPQRPAPAKPMPLKPAVKPAVSEPALVAAKPAIVASLDVGKSISDLAQRVTQTEKKIDTILERQDSGEATRAINAHIDALRSELEKLTAEHEKISVEVGGISTNVQALSESAGRIGPFGDSLDHLNQAILSLRQEMPGFADQAAERAGTHIASQLTGGGGTADLSDKLAAVQNLLLTQLRETQESDGRSFGALESIRGLVENLHSRIDALESGEPAPEISDKPPASNLQPHFVMASQHREGEQHAEAEGHQDDDQAAMQLGDLPQSAPAMHAMPPAMSREELIASARRAAANAGSKISAPAVETADTVSAASVARAAAAASATASAKPGLFGARPIVSFATVALLMAGLGMIYAKMMRPAMPPVTIEQAALPAMPDDPADAVPANKPAMAAAKKDASKPPAAMDTGADKAAMSKPAAPQKSSSAAPDEQGVPAANAGELPQAGAAKPAVVADLGTQQAPAADLPAAIAPLSMRTAATNGDPVAAYAIAERFMSGKDVTRDAAKGRHWFEQAANAGYPLAEFHLGLLFEKGDEGVAADRAKAIAWYRKGAEHGNVQAMYNLAVQFSSQQNNTPDYVSAAKWFEEAANYGLKDSQFNLAVLYQNGLGVPKNAATAYKWFAIGATHGDAEAAKQRDELAKTLTPDAVAATDTAVKAWHQKAPDHRANVGEMPGTASNAPVTSSTTTDPASNAVMEVSQVQKMLGKLGYDPGAVDGTLSAQTREAIKTFEQRSGLQPTGEISDALLGKLKALSG